jgi:2,4-dienoyl-CoA reductase-like NADH-dependent reductase (Old Yellow Enzyme family)
MAPMTRSQSPDGAPTPEVAAYYRRRAEGGIGLVLTEGVLIGHPSAGHERDIPRMTAGRAEAGWRQVVEEVHAAGSSIAAQLWHLGSLRECADGIPSWSPSGRRETGQRVGHAMTLADIDVIIGHYAESARVARRAGFDAIEIHGAHGYLVDEFLWSATNHRHDLYGGSRSARSRFAADIAQAVREATGPEFPIVFRFSQFKERDYAARLADTPDELAEVLGPIAPHVSLLHASARRAWEPAFPGSPLTIAGWAKRVTGLPTIAVGSVGLTTASALAPASCPASLAALVERHRDGEFDLVAVGRPLLGNPRWVELIASGRADRIRDYRKADEAVFC